MLGTVFLIFKILCSLISFHIQTKYHKLFTIIFYIISISVLISMFITPLTSKQLFFQFYSENFVRSEARYSEISSSFCHFNKGCCTFVPEHQMPKSISNKVLEKFVKKLQELTFILTNQIYE